MTDAAAPKLRLFREAMGLHPYGERYRQAMIALRGEEDVPPSKFGLSSLRQLRPRLALPLWRGRFVEPRRAIVTNLFNHRQTPIELGWSVEKTQVEDFRGRDLTYDSHNGTDFAIPVGTTVVAAAPGQVVRVVSEFNRGGLKIFIDHGDGLMTTCAHLARPLVTVGQRVARAEPIALSGYSGLDSLVTFPFGVPHVHFNTWLDGEPVDPFPHAGSASLWRAGALPEPARDAGAAAEPFAPSVHSEAGVAEIVAGCRTERVRRELLAIEPLAARGARTVIEMNYYPTRFAKRPNPYAEAHPRAPRLDLPFPADAFDGVVFADER
ncbi:MAG: M23 family metallopeptidase [Myxococcales bacterium]|nr:M23 family metallopeptidase [Myxococcales bacterium]